MRAFDIISGTTAAAGYVWSGWAVIHFLVSAEMWFEATMAFFAFFAAVALCAGLALDAWQGRS